MNGEHIDEREADFREEFLVWQRKCNDIERKLEEKIQQTTDESAKNSSVNETCEFYQDLHEQMSITKKAMKDIENRWSNWLQNITDRVLEGEQHSRKNSLLIHGYVLLPNIHGADFIDFVAREINYLFPSLKGTVTPFHIDDAHPLKTKRNGKKKLSSLNLLIAGLKTKS